MSRILIKNIRILSPKNELDLIGDILIKDGIIKQIGDIKGKKINDFEVIDGKNLTAVPGFFDMHCHLREPGFEYKEDIYTGTRAAARGGFTSVMCMANTEPVNDEPAITMSIIEKAKTDGAINVYPIGAVTKGLEGKYLTEMGLMGEAGCVAYSDDGKQLKSSKIMYNAMKYAKQFDKFIIAHCESELAKEGLMNEGFMSSKLGLKGINNVAEDMMVYRETALAESLDTRVHIAHISTKGSVDIIRNAKKRGVKVTCETCPHYIAGNEEMVDGFDTFAKVNPPLRDESDRLAIIEGIKDGTIDVIATDHAPHHMDEKNVEYQQAANGISGFETAFALCYTYLVKEGSITLERLIELMSINPTRIMNLNGGEIKEGASADITIIDTKTEYKIDVNAFISKGKNNPFNGTKVVGEVIYTFCNGQRVFRKTI